MSDPTANNIELILSELHLASKNRDLGGFSSTITKAMASRTIHALADNVAFWQSIEQLPAWVKFDDDLAFLLALAELGRVAATLRAKGRPVGPTALKLLNKRVPAHLSIGDGDQRYYAAVAWEHANFPVDAAVAARTAVLEESSDKARRAWLRLLLQQHNAEEAIGHLTVALRDMQWLHLPSSDRSPDPVKDRARRIVALLKALRAELDADRFEVGDGVASALSNFVPAAFALVPRPTKHSDTERAGTEFMHLVLHIIRMKFRLLTEPGIYAAAVKIRRWMVGGGWSRFTRYNTAAARLREVLVEGLVLLLKQGKVSQELTELHRQLSPTAQESAKALARIAAEERDLAPEIRTWLETGEYEQAEIALLETDDTAIAMALLAAHELPPTNWSEETSSPSLNANATSDLIRGAEELKARVLHVANRRNLTVFGEVGDVVDFSPHAHRSTGSGASSKARIVKSGVEVTAQGGSRVVIRAIVS